MPSYLWSSKSAVSSSSEKLNTTDQSIPHEEIVDMYEDTSSTQLDTDDRSINYPSISNSYTTEPYTTSAKLISQQISEDKLECRSVISQYGIDPNEFLQLLEQWTQSLIHEYKSKREHF